MTHHLALCSGGEADDEHIHITLFNSKPDGTLAPLVGVTLGMSIIDSACMKSVVAESWTNA